MERPTFFDNRIFPWVVSALIVAVVKFFSPWTLSWDEACQHEVAHRLVAGLGLTSTFLSIPSEDLCQDPLPRPYFHHPPGYSLLIAALLTLKLPILPSLRVLSFALTLGGWIGFGRIARLLFPAPEHPNERATFPWMAAWIIPWLWSPWWRGTDLYLWALTPWVLLIGSLPGKAYPYATFTRALQDAFLGMLVGILYWIRYASLFLLVWFHLWILIDTDCPRRFLIRRWICFWLGFSPLFFLLQFFQRIAETNHRGLIAPFLTIGGFGEVGSRLKELLLELGNTAQPFFFFLPGSWRRELVQGWPSCLFLWLLAVALLLWPFFLLRKDRLAPSSPQRRLLKACLWAILANFLTLSLAELASHDMEQGKIPFLLEDRYFWPVGACYPLVGIAALTGWRSGKALARWATAIFSPQWRAITTLVSLLALAGLFIRQPLRQWTAKALDEALRSMERPRNVFVTGKEKSKRYVHLLARSHPGAAFYIEDYPFYAFDWDPFHNPLRPIPPPSFWQHAWCSCSKELFWILGQSSPGAFSPKSSGYRKPLGNLGKHFSVELVTFFPEEEVAIFHSVVPAGYRFRGEP
ncbi:hypothetical protein [Candidatus Methylacidithermus pantelleriae]|uniref:Uncharacterized protein n=1 Tax=Candidatus Methylacidithermus pantelleriae TaxID=2744239 RepID=A0A8J2BQZ2_9BACT|nr:hypothetical protein [Candidatus Methylacidithermus pantelleriae]CAF0703464.1 membrane hypothetical protein [Candidatus Methylacidithermus pantelleriae]